MLNSKPKKAGTSIDNLYEDQYVSFLMKGVITVEGNLKNKEFLDIETRLFLYIIREASKGLQVSLECSLALTETLYRHFKKDKISLNPLTANMPARETCAFNIRGFTQFGSVSKQFKSSNKDVDLHREYVADSKGSLALMTAKLKLVLVPFSLRNRDEALLEGYRPVVRCSKEFRSIALKVLTKSTKDKGSGPSSNLDLLQKGKVNLALPPTGVDKSCQPSSPGSPHTLKKAMTGLMEKLSRSN